MRTALRSSLPLAVICVLSSPIPVPTSLRFKTGQGFCSPKGSLHRLRVVFRSFRAPGEIFRRCSEELRVVWKGGSSGASRFRGRREQENARDGCGASQFCRRGDLSPYVGTIEAPAVYSLEMRSWAKV